MGGRKLNMETHRKQLKFPSKMSIPIVTKNDGNQLNYHINLVQSSIWDFQIHIEDEMY